MGLRVRDQQLYCTYLLNAGGPGAAAPAGAPYAGSLLGTVSASGPSWFYAVAACNLTGTSGYPSNVTVLGLSSNLAIVVRSGLRAGEVVALSRPAAAAPEPPRTP